MKKKKSLSKLNLDSTEKRIGFIGILIQDREESAKEINQILSKYAEIIVGRMGLPYPQRKCWVITLIVDATTDQIGALTGKLGRIKGVCVKSGLSKKK